MNYVFSIQKTQLNDFYDFYKDYEFTTDLPNTLVVFRSSDVVVTIYESLKVMIQGKNALEEYLMWADLLGFLPMVSEEKSTNNSPKALSKPAIYYSSSLGSDEVGTGDFFGPVVVCTAFVEKSNIPVLEELGIKDSKQMSDEAIRKVALKLIEILPHAVLVVDNIKYNQLTEKGYNLNKMKAYLHNHAIKKCLLKVNNTYDYVILDQFCEPTQYYAYLNEVDAFHKITFFTKAESVHLAVAAASVIARYTFLSEMDKLNRKVGLRLPLGASMAVDLIGKRIVLEHGMDYLSGIAKMNFKNAEKIQNLMHPKN